jgi:hypothetical protein
MTRRIRNNTIWTLLCCIATLTSHAQENQSASDFRTLPGFEVELVYKVPMDSQGSWVAVCVDPKGRLITSDQYGKLYRVTLGN